MVKTGRIVEIKDKKVKIKIDNCSSCKECNICSSHKSKDSFAVFETNQIFLTGDYVSFEISDRDLIKFSILIYIFPLIFFFVGFFLSSVLFKNEALNILLSFLFLFISFFILFIFDFYKGKKFSPKNIHKL